MSLLIGNITLSELIDLSFPISVIITSAVVIFISIRSAYAKENNAVQEDLINNRGQKIVDLQAEVKEIKRRADEQQAMIEDLRKELTVWRDVPIKQLSDDYKVLADAMGQMSKLLEKLSEEKNGYKPSRR